MADPRLFPLVVTLALAPPVASAARTLVPTDVVAVRAPGDPRLSPDGRWVAYVQAGFDDSGSRRSHLDLGSTNGGPHRRLSGNLAASSPRWSPDGRTLAFIGRPEGGTATLRAFVLEHRIVGELSQETAGVLDFEWSPDGRTIAFLRRDPAVDPREGAPRPRVVGAEPNHVHLWLLEIDSGEVRRLPPTDRTVWHFGWSPDGRSIAALASESPIAEGHEYGSRLTLIDVESGSTEVLAERTNAQASPSFSPDGAWVAYLGPVAEFKERGIPYVVPASGGRPRPLLRDHPGNVWDLRWHPRRQRLLAAVAEGAEHRLVSLDLDGRLEPLLTLHHSIIPYWQPTWSMSADGSMIAFLSETTRRPAEIFVAATTPGASRRRLTDLNGHFEALDLGSVEAVRWRSAKDRAPVEGILVSPPAADPGPRPLLVWLHGGPAYNWGLGAHVESWAQLFAARGYRVLLPNFRGSSGYGMDWMMANVGDWGDGPMGDIMGGVDFLVERRLADPDRLLVGGGSYGGFLTFWTIAHSDRFRAAWARAGVSDIAVEFALTDEPSFLVGYFRKTPYEDPEIYRRSSPLTYAARIRTPLLIVHGENDLRVPLALSQLLRDALDHRGVDCELVIYPGEGHGIRGRAHQLDNMERALAWYDRWLRDAGGGAASP